MEVTNVLTDMQTPPSSPIHTCGKMQVVQPMQTWEQSKLHFRQPYLFAQGAIGDTVVTGQSQLQSATKRCAVENSDCWHGQSFQGRKYKLKLIRVSKGPAEKVRRKILIGLIQLGKTKRWLQAARTCTQAYLRVPLGPVNLSSWSMSAPARKDPCLALQTTTRFSSPLSALSFAWYNARARLRANSLSMILTSEFGLSRQITKMFIVPPRSKACITSQWTVIFFPIRTYTCTTLCRKLMVNYCYFNNWTFPAGAHHGLCSRKSRFFSQVLDIWTTGFGWETASQRPCGVLSEQQLSCSAKAQPSFLNSAGVTHVSFAPVFRRKVMGREQSEGRRL